MTGRQLLHERVGQARQGIVDGIADMAMVDADTVRRRDELDDLAGVQRAIDGLERTDARGALLGDRIGDLAQRRRGPDGCASARRVPAAGLGASLRSRSLSTLEVDHAAIDEPVERRIQRRESVHRETILEVVGVQEVERALERTRRERGSASVTGKR